MTLQLPHLILIGFTAVTIGIRLVNYMAHLARILLLGMLGPMLRLPLQLTVVEGVRNVVRLALLEQMQLKLALIISLELECRLVWLTQGVFASLRKALSELVNRLAIHSVVIGRRADGFFTDHARFDAGM